MTNPPQPQHPRIVQGDWRQCDHDWQLDFTGHTLMWRCTHCHMAIEAKSTP